MRDVCPTHRIPDCSPLLNGCSWAPTATGEVHDMSPGGFMDVQPTEGGALIEAERESLLADDLALSNLHADWGQAVLFAAVERIKADAYAAGLADATDGDYCTRCGRHRDWTGESAPGAPCMGCGRYPAARSQRPEGKPRCPGCGHTCCPYPGMECGGDSDAVRECEAAQRPEVVALAEAHGCAVEDEDTGRILICRACTQRPEGVTVTEPEPEVIRDSADAVVQIARLALAFGRVDRLTYHEDGVTRESDTDHTVMLGLIACAFAARHPEMGLDLGLVAQYALVHDLPEVYAGDTPTLRALDQAAAQTKDDREHQAWERICEETRALPWLGDAIATYEARLAPEARYVKAMDKVLPKLTQILNGGVCIREGDMRVAEVASRYREQDEEIRRYAADFPPIFDLRSELIGDLMTRLAEVFGDTEAGEES